LDVRRGSGTYVGIHVLLRSLERLGHEVTIESPKVHVPVFTVKRWLFNRSLRHSVDFDRTVGFDMDGYRIADVASLKGVIADEVRFESGLTRFTMGQQARWERLHVQRARQVIVTSRYSAERALEFYGLSDTPAIVPELIDLAEWRAALQRNPASSSRFTVLFVGRFYRRKRVDVLLKAAFLLREKIPELAVRIVGDGPCLPQWHELTRKLRLEGAVEWLGDVSRDRLASEYNSCDLFCLPSVQEGFGIVLLEAMAACKPIVASRAAAIPEVALYATLVEPDSPEALATGIQSLYESSSARADQVLAGKNWVEQFDASRVAQLFLESLAGTSATYTAA
jgi:glycosyltransferase involved in cell wall biosynthesis